MRAVVVGVAVLLAGCGTLFNSKPPAEIEFLRADVRALQAQMKQLSAQLTGLQSQLEQQQALQSRQATEVADRRRQLDLLQRKLETADANATAAARRSEEATARLDMAMRQITDLRSDVATLKSPKAAAPRPPSTVTTDLYSAARLDFNRGKFTDAIRQFQEFVRKTPDDPRAPQAQFSVGEAYAKLASDSDKAGQRERARTDRQNALKEFRTIASRYPFSDRAPAAVAREADIACALGDAGEATQRLQFLVDTWPKAPEVRGAQERLKPGKSCR